MADGDPILILTGPPGAGKTTAASSFASRQVRGVHLESDQFFHAIAAGYVEPWQTESHEQNTIVMGIVAQAAGAYATARYVTVIDGIVSPGWFLQPLRDHLEATGHPVAYAVLRPPLTVCIDRVAARSSPPVVKASVIEQVWQAFADLGDRERHVIPTVGCTVEETVDALEQRYSDGLLAL